MSLAKYRVILLAFACSVVALAAGFILGRREKAPAATNVGSRAVDGASLPRVPPLKSTLRRLDLTRKPTPAETAAYIARVAETGMYRANKEWEVIINSLEAAELPALLLEVDKLPEGQ